MLSNQGLPPWGKGDASRSPRATLWSQGTMPERPLRTSTLACGWEMAWAAHPPPGSEVQVTTCPRAPWIYYSICPCAPCAQLPPEGALLT